MQKFIVFAVEGCREVRKLNDHKRKGIVSDTGLKKKKKGIKKSRSRTKKAWNHSSQSMLRHLKFWCKWNKIIFQEWLPFPSNFWDT